MWPKGKTDPKRTTMEASKAAERQDTVPHKTRLDDRYGKIGISAVAAALHHQSKRPNGYAARETPRE
jgi:hypothetical protein